MMTHEADQPGNNNTSPHDVFLNRHLRPADRDISYEECLKNHAASIGGHALDGCLEFIPSPAATLADPKSLTCDACGCHRNFHRRCSPNDTHPPALPPSSNLPRITDFQPLNRHQPLHLAAASLPPISSTYYSPTTRLPVAPKKASGRRSGLQKRFRTKFSPVQKEKMLEFAEKVSWRMQRNDLGTVRDFCDGIGVNRNVFKVWMHNNKNTLGKRRISSSGGVITTNGTISDFRKNGYNVDDKHNQDNAVGSPSSSSS